MTALHDALTTEDSFFRGLVNADGDALAGVLADDFVLIDVMRGTEVDKASLLHVVGSRQLEFDAIEPAERRVRFYPGTAVFNGRSEIIGEFDGAPFAAKSRYTHVFVERNDGRKHVAAQGTQIIE